MKTMYAWALLRLLMGFMFLWAFFDKVFGLGYATTADKSWLHGVSPTTGFLKFGTHGMFAPFFQSLAGNPLIDWLFMLGLLGVGTALLLGIAVRFSSYVGALIVTLMYLSLLPPENNPLIDEHVVYLVVFLGLAMSDAGKTFGLGKWWSKQAVVKQYRILA